MLLPVWIWIQGQSLHEQNQSHKRSWESFAYVDEEEDEGAEKVCCSYEALLSDLVALN